MNREIKEKLEGIVDLLNNPEATVMDSEVINKLENILTLLREPNGVDMEKEKMEKVVELVNNVMVNPDIELEYHIPDVAESDDPDLSEDPYIHLKYMANGTHTMNQNIPIKRQYQKMSAEKIANLVTFYIQQFIEQIDSVEHGAQ